MKNFWVIILLLLSNAAFAQENDPMPNSFGRESEAERSDDESPEDDFLWQQSEFFKKHPVDINSVPEETLHAFPFLSPVQVQHFINYRKLIGPFIDIYELQAVPGWDIETINKLRPYLFLKGEKDTDYSLGYALRKGESAVLFRIGRVLEKSQGFTNSDTGSTYLGSPLKILARFKFQYKNLLQFGITAEKDAGEKLFGPKQKMGFDFYSFHFFKRGTGLVRVLALGDYHISLGQGLIHWQSFAFKKSTETIIIKRQSPVIRPYNSTDENRFHRGGAISLARKSTEFNLFVACDRMDANLAGDTSYQEGYFSSMQTSGYHRRLSELNDKDALTLFIAGANIIWRKKGFHLGLNTVLYRFNLPLKKANNPYNIFAISGKKWSNYSVDYGYTFRNLHLFGELAVDKNLAKAAIAGAMLSLHPRIDLSVLYRNISSHYHSLYANAFTVNAEPNNEKGLFVGLTIRPSNACKINLYADSYSFPWLKYRVNRPDFGADYLVEFLWKPDKRLEIESIYSFGVRLINDASNNDIIINPVVKIPVNKLRSAINYKLTQSIVIRSRLDLIWYGQKTASAEQGYSTLVDFFYNPLLKRFSFNLRAQYFETDGYDSRIYTYENDVMYYFSVPGLFNCGFRYYLNCKVDIFKSLTIWVKWAQTNYKGVKGIGTGADKIDGNHKSDLRVQMSLVF